MSNFSRRQLLTFFGVSAAAAVLSDGMGDGVKTIFGGNTVSAQTVSPLPLTPIRLPSPLPIYRTFTTFLPTGLNGQGTRIEPSNDGRLSAYAVVDDLVVPPEYERYTIISWGDRVFANRDEYFGYNCDFTAYSPINGNNEGYLWVNHEYNSFPISPLAPEAPADVQSTPSTFQPVIGFALPTSTTAAADRRIVWGEFLYNMGGSVVRIRKDSNGRFAPVQDTNNRRYHCLSGLGINSSRTDAYRTVTSWGDRSYQTGDQNFLIGTGAAASEVFERVNTDGLGNRIIGTGFNCSGGYTPWGTVLSCEENFQGAAGAFFVGVEEFNIRPNGGQAAYATGTTGAEFGQVGEKYGWVVEIDPSNPGFRARKHTALGRYRHENVALRAETGRRLVAYLGDDRRGGHTWKYVSTGTLGSLSDKNNSRLFEDGVLYVARFNADGTGVWIPMQLSTPTNPIKPSDITAIPFASGLFPANDRLNQGVFFLPRRNGVAGQTVDGGVLNVTRDTEGAVLPAYQGKRLSDFYTSLGAILVDAFPAGNLVGGTPTARPEDFEVNPRNPREVFVAYTDGAPGSDGYPDSRIFQVAKVTAEANGIQQSGSLFKIIEDSADSTGTTFRWERFAQGGEVGAAQGGGFANLDNLAFDTQGNIWGVIDMSTGTHNGFNVGAAGTPNTIDHSAVGNVANYTGVFGNNFVFYIPTSGDYAGQVVPFAYGPVRCECTGPTFIGDTFILAIQHPGEDCPYTPAQTLSRSIEMLDLNGDLFNQTRTVSRGSNWPSNIQGNATGVPKPTVVGIRRLSPLPGGTFV